MSGSNAFKRFTPRKTLAAIAVGSVLMMSAPAAMAADTSIVKGHIVSSEGATVSNATITLKHKTKGLVYTVHTNAKGDYLLRNVPVGDYDITITKDGFIQSQESNVRVSIGQSLILDGQLASESADNVERIAVTGSMIRRVDMSSSTSGLTFSQDELNTMPVDTGFENVALLAPGTAAPGGSSFNGASSFGGSSSAENAYYLNGLNITDIKTGLGSLALPWEAISQTQIKTGGVSPEFGGALGGIVNAVSKSGDNEFHFGVEGRWDPESMRSSHDSLYQSTGTIDTNTQQSGEDFKQFKVWASGAIVEDTLFYYGLYEPRKFTETYAGQTTYTDYESTSDRWFAKLDWYINENHSIGFMGMNNESKTTTKTYAYDWETNVVGDRLGVTAPGETGGQLYSLNYNGYLSDNFSVSAVIGRVVQEENTVPASTDPVVWDGRNGWVKLSQETNSTLYEEKYTRDMARMDFIWDLEEHSIGFGVDYTKVDVEYLEHPNGIGDGAAWWQIRTAGEGSVSGAAPGEDYVRGRVRNRFTSSEVNQLAFYVNDSWQATDNLVVNVGLRYSQSSNSMSDGTKYVDFDSQIAPRLQGIYDLHGDGSAKIYATYGRYFQPVSANMNITQGSSASDINYYYEMGEVDANGYSVLLPDGSPSRGDLINTDVTQDSTDAVASEIASTTLKPMYSDEFTLGYQQEVFDTMSAGVRVIWRDLGRGVEDSDITSPLNKKLAELGLGSASGVWFLHNPGESLTIAKDFDGDGQIDNVTLSPEEMALPSMQRHYLAMELTLDGSVTDDFRINSSYTLSNSWGNTEGLVKTDNDQADPGWTTSYDYGDIMDHSYGDLPNDHTHSFKLSGSYDITEEFIFGFVTSLTSGRPQNAYGRHPQNVDSCTAGNVWDACEGYYGHSSFYDENGNPTPRGSQDRLPWTTNVDLSLTYMTDIFDGDFSIKATAYNVLNSDTATNVYETRTKDGADGGLIVDPEYGRTTDRQGERFFSLIARYEF